MNLQCLDRVMRLVGVVLLVTACNVGKPKSPSQPQQSSPVAAPSPAAKVPAGSAAPTPPAPPVPPPAAPTPSPPAPTTVATPPLSRGRFEVTASGVGPISARTLVNLKALRDLLPTYRVSVEKAEGTAVFHVFDNKQKVLDVWPNENGTVFSVGVVRPEFVVLEHGWHVGDVFHDWAVLTDCMCESEDRTRLACWKQGEHVELEFSRSCSDIFGSEWTKRYDAAGAYRQRIKLLDGERVARVRWFAEPRKDLTLE